MQTFAKSVAIILASAPLVSGCALFGIKQQRDQQAANEEQVQQLQAQAAVQMKEAERQVKIAEARTAYLEQELDAQQYALDCATLSAAVEKVIVKMGRSVEHQADLLVTDWSHVQAKYEATYDYRIRQTQTASKSRYVAELVPAADGAACKVKATFQYANENGAEASDRALDLEARVLEQVEPERYAKIEAEFKAIEQRYPAG